MCIIYNRSDSWSGSFYEQGFNMGDWRFGVEYSDSFLLQFFLFYETFFPTLKVTSSGVGRLMKYILSAVLVWENIV